MEKRPDAAAAVAVVDAAAAAVGKSVGLDSDFSLVVTACLQLDGEQKIKLNLTGEKKHILGDVYSIL